MANFEFGRQQKLSQPPGYQRSYIGFNYDHRKFTPAFVYENDLRGIDKFKENYLSRLKAAKEYVNNAVKVLILLLSHLSLAKRRTELDTALFANRTTTSTSSTSEARNTSKKWMRVNSRGVSKRLRASLSSARREGLAPRNTEKHNENRWLQLAHIISLLK